MSRRKIEDYMKIIYSLLRTKGVARGADIASKLGVKKPTVSVSLDALCKEGYLRKLGDRSVILTPKGLTIAREISDRSDSLFNILVSLGVDEKTAAEDACSMEHAISRESYSALLILSGKHQKEKESSNG